jgi:hypothetical protein
VEAEIAAPEQAQREAQRQADKERLRGRRERSKQIHTRVEQLKSKLPQREQAASA